MFRVPQDPEKPSFDQTFKVGFVRWLKSSKPERKEWMRRRNAASAVAAANQQARAQAAKEAGRSQLGAVVKNRHRKDPDA